MKRNKVLDLHRATHTLQMTSIGLSTLLFIVALISTRQFFRLEQKEALTARDRVLTILEYQLEQVSSITADYSQWDDTWDFIQGKNPEYPEVNFTEDSLKNLGFAFVGIYTPIGKQFFSFNADKAYHPAIPEILPPSLLKNTQGLFLLGNVPYLVSIRTILHSDLSGPEAGYFMFGKTLDEGLLATISKLSGTTVTITVSDEAKSAKQINLGPSTIESILSIPLGLSSKSLILSIRIPRDLFWNGFRSLVLFFILAALTIIVLIINYASLQKLLAFEKNTAAILEEEVQERTESLRTYKKIIESTGEGILITDMKGTILEINPAIQNMTGFSEEELIGQTPNILKSGMHAPEFYRALWESVHQNGQWEGEIWNRKKDGTLLPFWLSINTLKDLEGNPCKLVAFYIDITQLKQTQEKLNNLAFFDSLTGLPNRALFTDRLDQVLSRAQREKSRFALLYMDLDHFKDVNDGFGHQVGDELLILAAHRVKAQVREADTVCRLGGDEFTVILEDIHKSTDASLVAKKII
ncbi:MAG TPA: diguanylate cyclase, partial [Treponema sp.]|nr:diguanylate cyclase [Treponema sp.]